MYCSHVSCIHGACVMGGGTWSRQNVAITSSLTCVTALTFISYYWWSSSSGVGISPLHMSEKSNSSRRQLVAVTDDPYDVGVGLHIINWQLAKKLFQVLEQLRLVFIWFYFHIFKPATNNLQRRFDYKSALHSMDGDYVVPRMCSEHTMFIHVDDVEYTVVGLLFRCRTIDVKWSTIRRRNTTVYSTSKNRRWNNVAFMTPTSRPNK